MGNTKQVDSSSRANASFASSWPSKIGAASASVFETDVRLLDRLYRRSDPSYYLLLLYRNRASVVIGRNQNPWTELNMQKLRELGIPVVRRRSGGGTVYHDLGNTNYCLLSPRDEFTRKRGADMVTRAVRKLGIPAYVNERHDICVEQFKVSGSAFKLGSKRAYHHGTMLIDAALHDLRGVLRNTKVRVRLELDEHESDCEQTRIQSKAIASVSSPVRNLEEWSAMIDHDSFVNGVAHEFLVEFAEGKGEPQIVSEQDMLQIEEVSRGAEELQSWDWLYGQTPEFSHDMSHAFRWGAIDLTLTSRRGLTTSVDVHTCDDEDVAAFLELHLPDERYAVLERTLVAAKSKSPAIREAIDWLMREM